jgi:hypothetical protein
VLTIIAGAAWTTYEIEALLAVMIAGVGGAWTWFWMAAIQAAYTPLNTTAKFSVLEAAEAVDFFKSQAPSTRAKADLRERLGLVSTYSNRGRE